MAENDDSNRRKHLAWLLLLLLLLVCFAAAYLTGWPVSLSQNHAAPSITPVATAVQPAPAQQQAAVDQPLPPEGKPQSSGTSVVPGK